MTAYECCGSAGCSRRDVVNDGIEGATPILTVMDEVPGFVGMLHSGKTDLAQRAKDIVRGRDDTDESLGKRSAGETSAL